MNRVELSEAEAGGPFGDGVEELGAKGFIRAVVSDVELEEGREEEGTSSCQPGCIYPEGTERAREVYELG